MECTTPGARSRIQPSSGKEQSCKHAVRAFLVSRRLSPLCDPYQRPRRNNEPLEEGWHWHRSSLPNSAALTEGLRITELPSRRLPSSGTSSCRNRLLANVSAPDRRTASSGSGGDFAFYFQDCS